MHLFAIAILTAIPAENREQMDFPALFKISIWSF